MMFNIFAANPDLRGSKLQEEASVDFDDFPTKYDGFLSKIEYIDYRNDTDLRTTNHTYPAYICYDIYSKQML